MTDHGTPEGFRLHKKLEHEPCPSCRIAMVQLLDGVRRYRASLQRSLDPVAPAVPFSAHQRTKWADRRAAEKAEIEPLPELPPVVIPATPCVGLESWMPSAPRSNLKNFRKAGWEARLTRAAGPRIAANGVVPPGKEVVYTVALAAQKADHRIVMIWEHKDGKWPLDVVLYNKRGVIKSTDLKEILNG